MSIKRIQQWAVWANKNLFGQALGRKIHSIAMAYFGQNYCPAIFAQISFFLNGANIILPLVDLENNLSWLLELTFSKKIRSNREFKDSLN